MHFSFCTYLAYKYCTSKGETTLVCLFTLKIARSYKGGRKKKNPQKEDCVSQTVIFTLTYACNLGLVVKEQERETSHTISKNWYQALPPEPLILLLVSSMELLLSPGAEVNLEITCNCHQEYSQVSVH